MGAMQPQTLRLLFQTAFFALIYGLEGLFPFYKNRTDRARHTLRNLSLGILNAVLVGLVFSSLTVGVIGWAESRSWGLLRLLNLSPAVKILSGLVLFDLWMYLWHRTNHNLPLLWRFHRVHHSDTEMDGSSAIRFHPGEIILSSLARLAVVPLLGLDFRSFFLYELLLQPVILLHHSNVALPEKWDRLLRAAIVTPDMHRVHHSDFVNETNSNYSSVFSFWDRIGNSYRKRETLSIRLGLQEFREPAWQTLAGMFKTPFTEAGEK